MSGTVQVTFKDGKFNGDVVNINEADFNPDIHAAVGESVEEAPKPKPKKAPARKKRAS